MKNKKNLIVYLSIVAALVTLLLIFYNTNDMLTMVLFAMIIVITSIFTYGNRRKN